jgi:hypothetical protein
MLDPDFLHCALVYFQGRSSAHDPNLAQCLATARTRGATSQWFFNYIRRVLSNLVQEALDQATAPAFVVLEQQLAATALHFDDSTFGHVGSL